MSFSEKFEYRKFLKYGLISLSAYSSWEDVFYEQMSYQSPVFLAKMVQPFVPLVALVKYKVNVWSVKPVKEIKKLRNRPALLIHSKEDTQVSFSNFERIIHHAPSHVKTFVRDGDIHFITESFTEPEKDIEYSIQILDFLNSNFSR